MCRGLHWRLGKERLLIPIRGAILLGLCLSGGAGRHDLLWAEQRLRNDGVEEMVAMEARGKIAHQQNIYGSRNSSPHFSVLYRFDPKTKE
jgi:hypothetical protein